MLCVVCHVSFPELGLSLSVFSLVMHISCFILYTYLSSHFRHFTSCPCVFPTCSITCFTLISFTCPSLVHSPVSTSLSHIYIVVPFPLFFVSLSKFHPRVAICSLNSVPVFRPCVPMDSVPVFCPHCSLELCSCMFSTCS